MRDGSLGLRPRQLSCDRNLELIIHLLTEDSEWPNRVRLVKYGGSFFRFSNALKRGLRFSFKRQADLCHKNVFLISTRDN